MAYLEAVDPDQADDDTDWFYTLGFYDDRGFWMTDNQLVIPSPLKWALITDPEKNG